MTAHLHQLSTLEIHASLAIEYDSIPMAIDFLVLMFDINKTY